MSLTGHLAHLVAQYNVAALFVSVSLETLGLPLPGESAVILSSGLAGAGELNIYAVVAAAFAGAVLGDNVAFAIGRKFGRPVIIRYGARVGITDAVFSRGEAMMQRRGPLIVVVARFFVLLRQLNGLLAGTTGMRWPIFLLANIVGAALWVGVWTTVGYRFGKSAAILPFLARHLALVAMIVTPMVIAVLIFVYFRDFRTRRDHRPPDRGGAD